tara:strand:- start:16551 stop:17870 length:1320 start_codon:yes stop_codon:yes gene_type:complete
MSKSRSSFNKLLLSLSPDAMIELFEIDFSNIQADFSMLADIVGANIGADSVYRFCAMKNSSNPIYWQGNGYQPMPIEAEGFEQQGDGRLPRPRLTLANPDGLFSKIVHSNHDFSNAKITRKRTFMRFLDDDNFIDPGTSNEAGKNPFGEADPDSHYPDDVYFINKKITENSQVIQFELVSALELQGAEIPARIVMPNYCNWVYRCSIGCGYKGLPIENSSGKSLISNFHETNDPSAFSRDPGSVNPDSYPRGIEDIPEWTRLGVDGSESDLKGYDLGDVVKITPNNATNPYQSTPSVYACIKKHVFAKDHHPFFDRGFWSKDECNKTLDACKKRFSNPEVSDTRRDFAAYVDNNSDLLNAFNAGNPTGPPSDARTYSNKADWGEVHWETYGKMEYTSGQRSVSPPMIDVDISSFNLHKISSKQGLRFGGFPGTDKYQPE